MFCKEGQYLMTLIDLWQHKTSKGMNDYFQHIIVCWKLPIYPLAWQRAIVYKSAGLNFWFLHESGETKTTYSSHFIKCTWHPVWSLSEPKGPLRWWETNSLIWWDEDWTLWNNILFYRQDKKMFSHNAQH